jgi:hypothetical protein
MDDSSDKSADEGVDKKPEARASDSNNLPVVWSPKLDAGAAVEEDAAAPSTDEATASEDAADTTKAEADEAAAAAPSPRSWRFMQLAATIALAAGLGSFAGSLAGSGISTPAPEVVSNAASAGSANSADVNAVLRALKAQVAELTAMKSSLDGSVRNTNTQFAAINDRLDRVERAAATPSAQLAHIADTVDRLDKINATPETTGSIGTSAPPSDPKITDRIVQDWMVQDVRGDRALVESRSGGLFEVGAGSVLPGLGKVESVKRQDGQWVVVTARGLITSAH